MQYIMPNPNPSGAYPAPQSNPFPGSITLTDEQAATLIQYNGFVTIGDTDGQITITPNTEAWEAWKTEHPAPAPLEAAKTAKLEALSNACEEVIVGGCDVTLSDGSTGHITLTEKDQINLTNAYAAVKDGAQVYPYHLDDGDCTVYSAADITIMAQAATAYVLYHTTYYNKLKKWVNRCETAEDVGAITYGVELPDDLSTEMAAILEAAANA